jgi:hypothetical protein
MILSISNNNSSLDKMKLLHFTLMPKIPKEQIEEEFKKGAHMFASIKELTWKIWIENEEDGTVGGLYYFKEDADYEVYRKSEIYKGTHAHPLWDVVSVKTYNILEEVSTVTRAPI